MTIKRSCGLGALLVLGLLSGPINSTRVQAAPVYDDMGNIVNQSSQSVGTVVGQSAQNVGTVVGQSAQNVGTVVGKSVQDVGTAVGKSAQDVGAAVGKSVQDVGTAVSTQITQVGQDVSTAVTQAGTAVGEAVGKVAGAVVQGVEDVTQYVDQASTGVTAASKNVATQSEEAAKQAAMAVDSTAKSADVAASAITGGFLDIAVGLFGKLAKDFPPILTPGRVINIISPKGVVYLEGDRLCVGNVGLGELRAKFTVFRTQGAYVWFKPSINPNLFIRHNPKGGGGDEYALVAKVPDFGYVQGGHWERFRIVDGKFIEATRWDGSLIESGGFWRTIDGKKLVTRNDAGTNYAFSQGEALPFIFLKVGSKEALAYNASLMQRTEYEKTPQLTAVQIAALPAGTKVTIQSAVDSKFLECPGAEKMDMFGDTSSWATFSCDNPVRPSAQFVILKSGNFIGLQASNGKLLDVVFPGGAGQPTWVVPGRAEKLEGAARWSVIQKGDDVCLKNETSGGCLNNRGGGVARAHGETQPWAPAGTDLNTVGVKMRLASSQKISVPVQPVAPAKPVVVPVQPVIPVQPVVPAQPVAIKAIDLWTDIGLNIMSLGGAQVIAHPSIEPFNKFVFKSPWYSSDKVAAFTFKAAAKQDVVIALSGAMDQSSGSDVRLFTIGGYNNTAIIMGPDKGGPIIKPAADMTILDGEDVYTRFWITYDKSTGMVAIGKGSIPGSNVLVSSKDAAPLKASKIYLGVGAWFDPKMGSTVFYNNISAISSVSVQAAVKEVVVSKVVEQPVASPVVAVEKAAPVKAIARAKSVAPAARKQTARGTNRSVKAPVAVAPEVTAAVVAPEVAPVAAPEVAPVAAQEAAQEVVAPVKKIAAPRARVTRGAADARRSRVSPAALQ